MRTVTPKSLMVLAVMFVALFSYLRKRDSIRLEAELSPTELKTVIGGIQEWSRPKLFRQIDVRPAADGNIAAWVREPGERWSVTVFTNQLGVWKQFAWFLTTEDKMPGRN